MTFGRTLKGFDVLDEIHALRTKRLSWLERLGMQLNFSVYKDEEEFLENPALTIERRVDLVRRLNGVNRRSGYHHVFIKELQSLIQSSPGGLKPASPLKILDIGVGGGELLERIYLWAKKNQVPVELYGIDVDSAFLEKTEELLKAKKIPVKLIHGNGQTLRPIENDGMDFVVSSYVVHHVRTLKSLSGFFEEIRRVSRVGWLIVDMDRRFWGPPFAWLSGYLFGASTPLVWDGVKSMRRAYTSEEINLVLKKCLTPGAWKGEMLCCPHPVLPYWKVKGIKTPLPRPSFIAPANVISISA